MCWWDTDGSFGGGIFMFLMMALFWGLVIWGSFILIRKLLQSNSGSRLNVIESPLDILKQRYAKGELTRDEFEQIKKDLT